MFRVVHPKTAMGNVFFKFFYQYKISNAQSFYQQNKKTYTHTNNDVCTHFDIFKSEIDSNICFNK